MTNLEFAKKELDYAGYKDNADNQENQYGKMVREAVLELLEVFEKQGHSGYSASVVSKIFMKLVDYKPISPIKETDEWFADRDEDLCQRHTRLSNLFRDEKINGGRAYYLDAIVWKCKYDECTTTFSGKVAGIYSRQTVKFPFTPKTFYIDCYEKDDEYFITDEKQLEEVWKYYDKFDDTLTEKGVEYEEKRKFKKYENVAKTQKECNECGNN